MAARIGNRKNAETALAFFEHTATPTDSWQSLSGGSYRVVWLHKPTGVCYKVEDSYTTDTMGNRMELNNARALRRMEWAHVRIPAVSGFNVKSACGDMILVLAMEHVEGTLGKDVERNYNMEARREIYEVAGFSDMHGENFFFDTQDYLVPIDMASPMLNLYRRNDWRNPDDRVLTCGGGSLWG